MAQTKALMKTGKKQVNRPKKVGEWADYICVAWQDSVKAIIETGKRISEAIEALPHGSKQKLYDELPFSERTAQCLMQIARDSRLSKPQHVAVLPASWGTLTMLTKLDDKAFKKAMDMGKIHPDMERSDVEELLAKSKPKIDKANAEDAEVVDQDDDYDEDEENNDEPPRKRSEPEPPPVRKKEKETPAKTPLETAFENFENSLDSMTEFAEKLDNAIDESPRNIDIDDELIDRIKKLGAYLTHLAKKHG